MKASILSLFFILTSFVFYGQTPDCHSIHEGVFKLTTKESGTTIIKRTKDMQIEENEFLGIKMTFDLKWISDCVYELRPKEMLKGDPAFMGKKGDYMSVKITEVKETSYMSETTSNFFTATLVFEIEIVK